MVVWKEREQCVRYYILFDAVWNRNITFLNECLWRFREERHIFCGGEGSFSSCDIHDFGRFSMVAVLY